MIIKPKLRPIVVLEPIGIELKDLSFNRIRRNINRYLRRYKKAKTYNKKEEYKDALISYRVALFEKKYDII